jgi:splicing factor 3A subunit 3
LHKQITLLECKIRKLALTCQDKIEATKQHVEKKQSRTVDEILVLITKPPCNVRTHARTHSRCTCAQAELEEEEGSDVEAESEEEEEVVVGKQNYPVGWDGKPIPYWLYKLHGLGIMYQCEICGNQTYQGRRAFERHFQEWRHAHGMRCLGIPNTKHFHEITKIKDAQDRTCPHLHVLFVLFVFIFLHAHRAHAFLHLQCGRS